MGRSIGPQGWGLLAAGLIAAAAAVFLFRTPDRWFTPAVQLLGLAAAIVFLWFGIRWSFTRLSDVYGD
ncbi:MAG: hypothetical protein ABEH59_02110 [Halobacteriales archaeon]